MIVDDTTTILSSAMRLSVPLMFAACGEYVAERAGTLNISVEAMMLGGAFGGAATASAAGNPAVGLLGGAAVGLAIGIIHANFSHRLAANTFVVGLTLNALVLGLTSYLVNTFSLKNELMGQLAIPGLSRIPVIGQPLFDQPWPCYLLYALVPLIWHLVQRTRWGLELRAVGEHRPEVYVADVHEHVVTGTQLALGRLGVSCQQLNR